MWWCCRGAAGGAPDGVESAATPEQALRIIKAKGDQRALVGGGAQTAGAFLQSNLVTDLVLDVEPVLFPSGIASLAGIDREVSLSFVSAAPRADGGVQLRYRIGDKRPREG